MGVMEVPEYSVTEYIRRLLFPLLVGLAIGFGLSELPAPYATIAVLTFAAFGIGYCVWALIDTRRALRRLADVQARGAAYIASFDRDKRA